MNFPGSKRDDKAKGQLPNGKKPLRSNTNFKAAFHPNHFANKIAKERREDLADGEAQLRKVFGYSNLRDVAQPGQKIR
jgi:hypothetical protein